MHGVARTLLLSALIAATACSGAESTPAPSPVRTTGTSPAAVAPPAMQSPAPLPAATETSSSAPLGEEQGAPQCDTASEGQAMTCTTTVFEPQFTLELPAGWMPDPGNPDLVNSSSYLTEDESGYLSFNRVSEVFRYADGVPPQIVAAPEDMIGYFSDLPGVEAGEAEPVTVAGRQGERLDIIITDVAGLEAPPDCGPPQEAVYVFNLGPSCEPFYFPANEVVRLVVLDASQGEPALVISMEASPPEARAEVFGAFPQILRSVRFEGPW